MKRKARLLVYPRKPVMERNKFGKKKQTLEPIRAANQDAFRLIYSPILGNNAKGRTTQSVNRIRSNLPSSYQAFLENKERT